MAENNNTKDFGALPEAEKKKVIAQARVAVQLYNDSAKMMSIALNKVYAVLAPYGEPAGATGKIILAGGPWVNSSLDCVPFLTIPGEPFPDKPGCKETDGGLPC